MEPGPVGNGPRLDEDDSLSPTALNFAFAIPGADQPVEASVLPGTVGAITLRRYPARATALIQYAPLPVGFEDAFSTAFCGDIRQRAEAVQAGSFGARQNRFLVRENAEAFVHIPLSPLVDASLLDRAARAAIDAGSTSVSHFLVNPVVLSGARLRVSFAQGAITPVLGSAEVVAELEAQFEGQRASALGSGIFGAGIRAKDFLCDLHSGLATLNFELEGLAGSTVIQATTVASGLAPL